MVSDPPQGRVGRLPISAWVLAAGAQQMDLITKRENRLREHIICAENTQMVGAEPLLLRPVGDQSAAAFMQRFWLIARPERSATPPHCAQHDRST